MKRVKITFKKPCKYTYLDSVHAAIISGLVAAGANIDDVKGRFAKTWTFSLYQTINQDGRKILNGITLSTSDSKLGEIFEKVKPDEMCRVSNNGDKIDMMGARRYSLPEPEFGENIRVKFISPFILTERGSKGKRWLNSIRDVNLNETFSYGLSKRMGREVSLRIEMDMFTKRCAKPIIINTRKNLKSGRDIKIPGFLGIMDIKGDEDVIKEAYFGGLGEKIRNGFGCIDLVK